MENIEHLGQFKIQSMNEGGTLMVTIPKPFVNAMNLKGGKDGDKVSIYRKGRKLIIELVGEHNGKEGQKEGKEVRT